MSTFFQGMDVAAGTALAEELRTAAAMWGRGHDAALTALYNVQWDGDDSTEFRERLTSGTLPALLEAKTRLEDFALLLDEQVQQQKIASQVSMPTQNLPGMLPPHGTPRNMGSPVTDDSIYLSTTLAKLGVGSLGPLEAALRIVDRYGIPIPMPLPGLPLPLPIPLPTLFPLSVPVDIPDGAFDTIDDIQANAADSSPTTLVDVEDHPGSEAPDELSDLIATVEETRNENGGGPQRENIRIQEVRTASGDTAYVVYIPPTSGGMENLAAWDGSQGNSRDWLADLLLTADRTTQSRANVIKAMEEFGIPKGAPVMLAGHSQGGVLATALAKDPTFNGAGGYNVTDVVAWGSTAESTKPAQTATRVTTVSHTETDGPFIDTTGAAVAAIGSRNIGSAISALYDYDGDVVPFGDIGGWGLHRETRSGWGIPYFGPSYSDQIHAVELPGYDGDGFMDTMQKNHDSYYQPPGGEVDKSIGYYASVDAYQDVHPDLIAARTSADGIYMGDGVTVTRDTTLSFERDPGS